MFALNVISTRSILIANALNAKLYLIKSLPPYMDTIYKISKLLRRDRINTAIIQLPSGPILPPVLLFKYTSKLKTIADIHTGFITSGVEITKHNLLSTPFRPFLELVDVILLHNETNLVLLPRYLRRKAMILYDPFYVIENLLNKPCTSNFMSKALPANYAVFPASWHPDEPLDMLVKAWVQKDITTPLVITGKPKEPLYSIAMKYVKEKPGKIIITGFIKDYQEYLCLISNALFVVSATTSNFDMQCSAYEALALGKPIMASDRLAIRTVLKDTPVYFDINDETSILKAYNKIIENYDKNIQQTKIFAKYLREKIQRQMESLLDKL